VSEGAEYLENEIRAMFAVRSEDVPVSGVPYRALHQRLVAARKKRRRRIGGSMLATALVAAGAGAWAVGAVPHRSAQPLSPTGQTGSAPKPVRFEYADGSPVADDDGVYVPFLKQAAEDYLSSQHQGDLTRDGYTIVTTFDRSMMAAAQRTGDVMWQDNGPMLPGGTRLAFASVDSNTGAVKAFYDGADAFTAQVPIGQLMFPVVMAAAVDSGAFSAASQEPASNTRPMYWPIGSTRPADHITYVDDRGQTRNWPPAVDDQPVVSLGSTASLAQGVEYSLSSVICDLEMEAPITPAKVYRYATALGLSPDTRDLAENPALCLGPASTSPLAMASLYGSFADGGVHHEPMMVAKVLDGSGRAVWTADSHGTRVLLKETADAVTASLQAAVGVGTGSSNPELAAYGNDRAPRAAGKTSTLADQDAVWFTGYVGGLVTAVAVFEPSQTFSFRHIGADGLGFGIPATVWTRFTKAVIP
jgi:membrane peptidoglycan carboxypeptidase